ncbi:MAG: peptide chain release factor N(5)-glutamine methyltransferase [Actinomycetota bacterium]
MTAAMKDLVSEIEDTLSSAGIENATRESEWIVESASGLVRTEIALYRGPVEQPVIAKARELACRRADGEPLQYVTGVVGFRRLELQIGPGALIPRPESELVTGVALDLLPEGGLLVDIGTGAGAMALAVADERSDATVIATDLAAEALEWARKNRELLDLEVEFFEGDLFECLPEKLRGSVDVVVSNPPYVPEDFSLAPVIRDHEPHVALFAAGDGLEIIERLIAAAPEWLKPRGWVVLEMDHAQRDAVRRLFEASGYRDIEIIEDQTGRPRIVRARRP